MARPSRWGRALRLGLRGHAALTVLLSCSLVLACVGPLVPASRKPAWQQPPPPVRDAPVVQPGSLTRTSLENGLQILVLEDRRLPTVSIALTVRRGAGAVPHDRAGLVEFTAELMNRGAGERDALALARAVDDIGAQLDVSAHWDWMAVNVSGLSRDLDTLLAILSDVARTPRLAADEAEKTRSEHIADLQAAKDSPATLAMWQAMAAIYDGHRYGAPLEGTAAAVESFTAEDARALHARYFVPDNAILSVAGDVESAVFLDRARALFGDWERGGALVDTPPSPHPTPSARRIVIADEPDLVQARITIVHEGLARTDDRRIAADLMNDTLGGSGFSSRLMQTLRSDQGLTYSVGSGFGLRRQPGPFVVSTFTRVPETRRVVDILLAELEAIRGGRPQTAEELAKAKSFNVGQFGLGLETSAAVMSALVDLAVYGLPDDSLDTYRSRVSRVSLEEAQGIARSLLHPDRAAIVLLGPAEALAPQFEDLGPITIVRP